MKKQLLAVSAISAISAVAGLAGAADDPGPMAPLAEMQYYLPVCNAMLPPGVFCVEPVDYEALRPPYIPPAIWRQIVAR